MVSKVNASNFFKNPTLTLLNLPDTIIIYIFQLAMSNIKEVATLSDTCRKFERLAKNDLIFPYPGKSAIFKAEANNETWEDEFNWGYDVSLIRKLIFKSTIHDSLFSKFDLLGYKNGSVAIWVDFIEEKWSEVSFYFKAFGFKDKSSFDLQRTSLMTTNVEDLRMTFKIIVENNEMSTESLEKITEIVSRGYFEPTPSSRRREGAYTSFRDHLIYE